MEKYKKSTFDFYGVLKMNETKCVIFGVVILALFALIVTLKPDINAKGLYNLYGQFASGFFGLVTGYAINKVKNKNKKDN